MVPPVVVAGQSPSKTGVNALSPGHSRLCHAANIRKTWMPATSAGMTAYNVGVETPNQSTGTNGTAPLAGIRVLGFCHAIMGPSAGLILADLGADVIKVG